MSWLRVDKKLEEEGWSLSIIKAHGQCRATYLHAVHMPVSAEGGSIAEAMRKAQAKMRVVGNAKI